jgi:uncharacterized protein
MMNIQSNQIPANRPRVDIADVLRGIAVLGILLLHSVEHFNYYRFPEASQCRLLAFSDKAFWDGLFFTFSGKAYAIFSILFGYTFFLQNDRARREGRPFRLRFVWRMALLFIFGNLNAAFFPGEVLVLFSIVGLALPLVAKLPDRWVLAIAGVMLLGPDSITGIVRSLSAGGDALATPAFVPWWQSCMDTLDRGNFLASLRSNLTNGQMFSILWAKDFGRMMQSPALMMLGMLIGRRSLFAGTDANIRFWIKAALVALVCFFPLKGLAELAPQYIGNAGAKHYLEQLLGAWHKLAFTVFEVGAIIVVFHRTPLRATLMRITPLGRMSLTMYIGQSVLASALLFPWGLDLGRQLGSTASLAVAVAMFAILYAFATRWLKTRRQGPLEYIWRRATWPGGGK